MSFGDFVNDVRDGFRTATNAVKDEGEKATDSIIDVGEDFKDDLERAGKEGMEHARLLVDHFTSDLEQALKFIKILEHLDFSEKGQLKPADPGYVNNEMWSQIADSPNGRLPSTEKLAHPKSAPGLFTEAAKMTGYERKIDYGQSVSQQTGTLLAAGLFLDLGAEGGGSFNAGMWFEASDFGIYFSPAANFGFLLGATGGASFTYIDKKYGISGFGGPASAITIAGGEGMVVSVSLLLHGNLPVAWAESEIEPMRPLDLDYMGIGASVGAGVGSPVEVYGSYSTTLIEQWKDLQKSSAQ